MGRDDDLRKEWGAERKERRVLSFFFYGTLMDPDLRAAVLGGPCASLRPAVLPDYRRAPVVGQAYPGIASAKRRRVAGLLATGVTPAMAARASFYEGDQYVAVTVSVTAADDAAQDAWTFRPVAGIRLGLRDWDLAQWQRRRKTEAVREAAVAMKRLPASAYRPLLTAWQTM